jgi:hypothetical protein
MTSKEHANLIFERFKGIKSYWMNLKKETGEDSINYIMAKQAAIMAIDEIIMFMESDDLDSDTCYWANHYKMEYFLQVKKEIEIL